MENVAFDLENDALFVVAHEASAVASPRYITETNSPVFHLVPLKVHIVASLNCGDFVESDSFGSNHWEIEVLDFNSILEDSAK